MTWYQILFMAIGFMVICYWITGVLMFLYGAPIWVCPGTSWGDKLGAVAMAGLTMPYVVFNVGRMPTFSVIMPVNPTPEQILAIEQWQKSTCPCNKCRRRRGEIE